ncbi:MAG: acyl-CoA dehydratase activase-related protein [Gammaproteobacteria bacterium]|nr:acyl-CoA dehydratase activase-related protein [Gammaproteobacteria bacterium]
MNTSISIGIDVGSTTAKCVVVDMATMEILWSRYERHETRQAEKVLELLSAIHQTYPQLSDSDIKAFITGSGAGPLIDVIGARFVQEVNAVALAVEKKHPDVSSVIELGGQDAKIILFKENEGTGERQIITSMNDKCASGTGATIDKCILKVGIKREHLSSLKFDAGKIHHVAAKCGVFAETDIVNLIKSGIPSSEVLCSLADAIVMQNLSVLTRGNTLTEKVLLLGGPNTYLPFLQQCWKYRIPQTWAERGYQVADGIDESELIIVPDNAEYYAAYGAVVFGSTEQSQTTRYKGLSGLSEFICSGRKSNLNSSADRGLHTTVTELQEFQKKYKTPQFKPRSYDKGSTIKAYIGLDGGSTSSKAVMIDQQGELICKQYQLSKGNPIEDTKELLAGLKNYAVSQGCQLEILGFGATGYAADVLEKSTRCDVNVVETVAHMMSAKITCGDDIDVICDIGGQDIKVLFLQHGQIKSFRLSNQCSAGNGMLLQSMADQFGVKVEAFSEVAFTAELSPKFSYGCAVFLDTDRVNFQKEGFSKEELFAGMARVLPKNVWQYVVQIPRMSELGRKFVLQGGTQYNLAAVKAQVDYIKERVPDAEVIVHPHCGEAGAMGAAIEAKRVVEQRGFSSFIGIDETIGLKVSSRTDEETRCNFCENNCSRTFIDTEAPDGQVSRYIAGFSCEKGTVESRQAVVSLNKNRKKLKADYPNLVDYEASRVFRRIPAGKTNESTEPQQGFIATAKLKNMLALFGRAKRTAETDSIRLLRRSIRVGIPRVLNHYTNAPFMRAYLEQLGLAASNIVFSDQTSEELWNEGGKYGSIDPCYPAKVSLAHIHHLLYKKHKRKALNVIWFPCITKIQSFTSEMEDSTTCPVVAGTPKVVHAAFTKEKDYFKQNRIEYFDRALDFTDKTLLAKQLYETWSALLKLTEEENNNACLKAWQAMQTVDIDLQRRGLQILTEAEKNNSIVLLMLGRPYHNDPGLNHEILEEFQSLGYPVISIRSIPKDSAYLSRYFKHDIEKGLIKDVFDITDVWPENYSVNSVQKVWAAKFAARHPNVAILDLSSFKCGHDAPSYGIVDQIVATSKTPYMAMHDIDANKPGGSIKIRVKTYAYTLQRYQEKLNDQLKQVNELEKRVKKKRIELLQQHIKEFDDVLRHDDRDKWKQIDEQYQRYLQESADKHDIFSEKVVAIDETSVTVQFNKNFSQQVAVTQAENNKDELNKMKNQQAAGFNTQEKKQRQGDKVI